MSVGCTCDSCTGAFRNSESVNSELGNFTARRVPPCKNTESTPSSTVGSRNLSCKWCCLRSNRHEPRSDRVASYVIGLALVGFRIFADEKFLLALSDVTFFLFTVAGWVCAFNHVTKFAYLLLLRNNAEHELRKTRFDIHSSLSSTTCRTVGCCQFAETMFFFEQLRSLQRSATSLLASSASNPSTNPLSGELRSAALSSPQPSKSAPENAMGDDINARIAAARTDLENITRAVNSASGDAKLDLDRQERRAEAKLQRLLTEQTNGKLSDVTSCLQRHENEIGRLSDLGNEHTGAIAENREEIVAVKGRMNLFEERLQFVEALALQTRDQTERMDNEMRSQNIILYGCKGTVKETLDKVMAGKPEFRAAVDRAYFIGSEVGDGTHAFKIQFTKVSVYTAYAKWTKTPEFASKAHEVRTGRDQTIVKRTGMSRLAAATEHLQAKLPNVFITASSTVLKLAGQKYDAIEFAAPTISLSGTDFDIDAICQGNASYEPNPSLVAQVGDVEIQGYRKKRSRRSNSKDNTKAASQDSRRKPRVNAKSNTRNKSQKGSQKPSTGTAMPSVSGESDFGVAIGASSSRRGGGDNMLVVGGLHDRYDVRK